MVQVDGEGRWIGVIFWWRGETGKMDIWMQWIQRKLQLDMYQLDSRAMPYLVCIGFMS